MNWPSRFNLSSKLGAWLDRLLDKAKRSEIVESSHVRVVPSSHGTQLYIKPRAAGSPGEPGTITQYKLVSVQNDHLIAHTFDGTTEGSTDIEIAKPYKLRRTPFHGQTLQFVLEDPISGNRTYSIAYTYHSATFRVAVITPQAGGNSVTERQVIIPQYRAGDLIYATEVENGTDLAGISKIDLNADGRAWSRKQ